jgi:excisionase family DNA binding protein
LPNQQNTSLEEISKITGVEYAKVKRIAQLLPAPAGGGELIYYTPEEVANILQVHQKTVEDWYKTDKIPSISVGDRTIRIPRRGLMLALRKMKRNSE